MKGIQDALVKTIEFLKEDDFDNKYELYGLQIRDRQLEIIAYSIFAIFLTAFNIILSLFFMGNVLAVSIIVVITMLPYLKANRLKNKTKREQEKIKEIKDNIVNRLGLKYGNLIINTFYQLKGQIKVYDIVNGHRKRLMNLLDNNADYSDADLKLLESLY